MMKETLAEILYQSRSFTFITKTKILHRLRLS